MAPMCDNPAEGCSNLRVVHVVDVGPPDQVRQVVPEPSHQL